MAARELKPAEIAALGRGRLLDLAERGIVHVMQSAPIPTNRAELPEYKRRAHLKGKQISIGEASRKYNIPHPTISRWVKAGYIVKLGTVAGKRVLIDEAEIAYCAEVYRKRSGQGRWVFNPDGTPYTKQ